MTNQIIFTHQIDDMRREENPLESILNTIVFSSADWGQSRDMAWIYGIVVGWDDEDDGIDNENAMEGVATDLGWSADKVARLRRLHAAFNGMRAPR